MKNSTKWIAIVATAAAIFFSVNVKAQTTNEGAWRLGFGIEGGVPTGALHTSPAYSKFELGGTARLQYGVAENVALTFTSGYYNFFATQSAKDRGGENFGVVPVKGGAKAFVTDNFYVAGEAGIGFETKYTKVKKLILSPGIGWADKTWDVGLSYENFSRRGNYGLVALRLAYGFSL
ncbi:MAG: hypothetical protein JWR09_1255 [Mucilaginibacter sp.]|nr:hypothetical protein [Mucilaginibacter sp.]